MSTTLLMPAFTQPVTIPPLLNNQTKWRYFKAHIEIWRVKYASKPKTTSRQSSSSEDEEPLPGRSPVRRRIGEQYIVELHLNTAQMEDLGGDEGTPGTN